MATSSRSLRTMLGWLLLGGIVVIAYLLIRPNIGAIDFGGPDRGRPSIDSGDSGDTETPVLRVRDDIAYIDDTPAGRGEAEPKDGEVWFEPYTLEEEIADSTPEVIVGRVLDPAGTPVSGVGVTLVHDDGEPPDPDWDSYSSETDETGWFLFEGLRKGRLYRVIASRAVPRKRDWRKGRPQADDELSWVERIVVEGVKAGRRDVRVRMTARPDPEQEWTARVRVIGPDGKDVARWSYTECSDNARWSSIEGWVEPEPGEPGIVRFYGPPPFGLMIHGIVDEEYEPLPIAAGYIHGIVPGDEVYVVRLKRAQSIRGRVDLPGNMDMANVVLRYAILADGTVEDPTLVSDSTLPGAWDWDMTGTDDQGRFELDGLPPGRVRLIPLPPGARLEDAPDDLGTTVEVGRTDVRLPMPAHGRIRGRIDLGAVESAQDVHVQVHLRRRVNGRDVVVWSKDISEGELLTSGGKFETDLRPHDESYDVEVWAHGMLPGPRESLSSWPLAMRRIRDVHPISPELFVVLKRLPSLSGTVVTGPRPPEGPAGLDDAPTNGIAGVHIRALSVDAHPLVRAALLGGDVALVDLGGDLESLVAGGAAGVPPEPPVLPPPGVGPWATWADDRGRFRFPALPPGRYLLWTVGQHGFGGILGDGVRAGAREVDVIVGKPKRITGRLGAGSGGLARGFLVEARAAEDPGVVIAASSVRSDGYFELVGLGDGPYLVTAHNALDPDDMRMAAYTNVPGGSERLAIVLAEGASVAGHVVDGRGGSVHGARVEVLSDLEARSTRAAADGSFRIGGLIAPEVRVRAHLPGGRKVEVIVTGGAEDVRLVVP